MTTFQTSSAEVLVDARFSCSAFTERLLVFDAASNMPTTPRHGIPIEVPRDQLWFWRPEWLAGEHAASAEIAAGRVSRFDNDEDFFASL